ncbi:Hydroxyacylglutathione hydrolase GloC [Anaerolineae bacterium]|nr:Hydroxyacylglutathione hydrolase GloC [Anaerolineae bacterium]
MAPILHQLTEHITAIDLQFKGRPEVIASYLFFNGETAALIETGPASTVDTLLESVQAAGVPLEAVRQLIVTHIHLDHSGAAGVIAKQLPWVRVYVHPIGAPHLADPSKLLASALRLYGDEMESLWGMPAPVPAENLVVVNDGDAIPVPGTTLRALDTPGHARHHHAYLDENSGLLFTGDVGGVRMPGVRYVRPPTPPPELDIEAWVASIAKLRATNATGLCPTHFGLFRGNLDWHWTDLERRLIHWGQIVREELERGTMDTALLNRMKAQIESEMEKLGVDIASYDVAASYESIVSGYVRYWTKKNAASK